MLKPLATDALRWRCDPHALEFGTTAEVDPVVGFVGQDTAVDALRFGIECAAPEQNVFVRGQTGLGRMSIITRLLEDIPVERAFVPGTRALCFAEDVELHAPLPIEFRCAP